MMDETEKERLFKKLKLIQENKWDDVLQMALEELYEEVSKTITSNFSTGEKVFEKDGIKIKQILLQEGIPENWRLMLTKGRALYGDE